MSPRDPRLPSSLQPLGWDLREEARPPRERRAGKPWWCSRSLWANVAMFLTAAAVLPELPPQASRYALMLASLINIGLRVMTRQPLKAKGRSC